MSKHFYKCEECDTVFFVGTSMENRTLICGGGCGGKLIEITEDEANATVEELR